MPRRPRNPCGHPRCPDLVDGPGNCAKHRGKVTVVCGLPATGKSTYVQQAKRRGDVVWDFDVIMSALLDLPSRDRPDECTPILLAMRDALVRSLKDAPLERDAWIIVTKKELASAIAADLGGEIVKLEVAEDERHARLQQRHADGRQR